MKRRMRGLAIFAVAIAMPACTALAGLTEDYRYVGDGGPGVGGEGGGEGGTVDGALPDGFVPGQDGGPDAPIDRFVTDGGAFCDSVDRANGFDFCDDFEATALGAGKPAGWTSLQNGIGATVAVVAGGHAGGSRGLDIVTNVGAGGSRNVYLVKTLAANKPNPADYLQYDIDFDFMVVTSATVYEAVGVLNFTNASPEDHGVAVYKTDDVVARLNPKTTGVSGAVGTWHHAHISLAHATAGTAFTRKITIDGEAPANTVDMTTNISTAGTTTTEIRVGVFYTSTEGGEVHVVFDNVVARRK
jgi:hypothetical protein